MQNEVQTEYINAFKSKRIQRISHVNYDHFVVQCLCLKARVRLFK